MEKLLKNDSILAVEKNSVLENVETNFSSNYEYTKELKLIGADFFWEHSSDYSGQGVNIAIIGDGITNHEDVKVYGGVNCVGAGYCTNGYYEAENGHENHVAGIISGEHNGKGADGIAPNATLYSVKVATAFDDIYFLTTDDFLVGLDWILGTHYDQNMNNDIDIVNISLRTFETTAGNLLIELLTARDVLLVGSSGNNGKEGERCGEIIENMNFPATNRNVIAVGNVGVDPSDGKLKKICTSSIGSELDIVAPGFQINSSIPIEYDTEDGIVDGYEIKSGTSMAAPVVTGVLAILKEKYPNLTSNQLKEKLFETTIPLKGDKESELTYDKNWEFGYGLVQLSDNELKGELDITSSIDTYKAPYTDSIKMGEIKNTKVNYYQKWNDWYKVEDENGNRVWVDMKEKIEFEIEITEATPAYKEPSVSTENIFIVPSGTIVKTKNAFDYNSEKAEFDWYQVETALGIGWIQASIKKEPREYMGQMFFYSDYLLYEYPKEDAPKKTVNDVNGPNNNVFGVTYHGYDWNEEEKRYNWYLIEFGDGLNAWYKKEYDEYTTTSTENGTNDGIINSWEDYISSSAVQKAKENALLIGRETPFFEEHNLLKKEVFQEMMDKYYDPAGTNGKFKYLTLAYIDNSQYEYEVQNSVQLYLSGSELYNQYHSYYRHDVIRETEYSKAASVRPTLQSYSLNYDYYHVNYITNKSKFYYYPFNYTNGFESTTMTTFETLPLFESIQSGQDSLGSILPQKIDISGKYGDWYHITTTEGLKWVKPENYAIGEFTLETTQSENIYQNVDDSSPIGTIEPHVWTVIDISGEDELWFKIKNTANGEAWILPNNAIINKKSKLDANGIPQYIWTNKPTFLYDYPDDETITEVLFQQQPVHIHAEASGELQGKYVKWYYIETLQGFKWIPKSATQ